MENFIRYSIKRVGKRLLIEFRSRSGTTLLQRLLVNHPQIDIFVGTSFFILNSKERDIFPIFDKRFLSILSMILKLEDSFKYTNKIGRKDSTLESKLYNQFELANEMIARGTV